MTQWAGGQHPLLTALRHNPQTGALQAAAGRRSQMSQQAAQMKMMADQEKARRFQQMLGNMTQMLQQRQQQQWRTGQMEQERGLRRELSGAHIGAQKELRDVIEKGMGTRMGLGHVQAKELQLLGQEFTEAISAQDFTRGLEKLDKMQTFTAGAAEKQREARKEEVEQAAVVTQIREKTAFERKKKLIDMGFKHDMEIMEARERIRGTDPTQELARMRLQEAQRAAPSSKQAAQFNDLSTSMMAKLAQYADSMVIADEKDQMTVNPPVKRLLEMYEAALEKAWPHMTQDEREFALTVKRTQFIEPIAARWEEYEQEAKKFPSFEIPPGPMQQMPGWMVPTPRQQRGLTPRK